MLMFFFLLFLQDLSKGIPVTACTPVLIGRPTAGKFFISDHFSIHLYMLARPTQNLRLLFLNRLCCNVYTRKYVNEVNCVTSRAWTITYI